MRHTPFYRPMLAACLAAALGAGLLGGCAQTAAQPAAAPGSQAAEPVAAPAAEAAAVPAEEPTAAPTAEPTPTPDPIGEKLDAMTLREKVGQLFCIRPDSLDPSLTDEEIADAKAEGVKALSDPMREMLAEYPVGGVALFRKNITDPDQLTAFVVDMQAAGGTPLFVGVDEEGGIVSRIANHPSFETPQYESVAAVGDTGDPANAREMGHTIGGYLIPYGFNLDFAPDADVNTNPDNPVIGTRAFSNDPQVAADMVAAAVEGFHEVGMICAIKHFPGHGDTAEDSHYGCATTEKTWAEMLSCEMLPFESGIAAGADMVMVAHITTPNATTDGLPASLSAQMITDKLRGELGYTGVVITDSLAMEAITDAFAPGEAALDALAAGADILLMPENLPAAFDAVVAAVENGTVSEERLEESVRRVLELKQRYGLL